MLIGIKSSEISNQLRDAYSICRHCWNVVESCAVTSLTWLTITEHLVYRLTFFYMHDELTLSVRMDIQRCNIQRIAIIPLCKHGCFIIFYKPPACFNTQPSKWWLQLIPWFSSFLVSSNSLSRKCWLESQALKYRINWEMHTPYAGAAGMLLQIYVKFTMGKLKSSLLVIFKGSLSIHCTNTVASSFSTRPLPALICPSLQLIQNCLYSSPFKRLS
jgi:hypothetical protein